MPIKFQAGFELNKSNPPNILTHTKPQGVPEPTRREGSNNYRMWVQTGVGEGEFHPGIIPRQVPCCDFPASRVGTKGYSLALRQRE